MHFLIRLAQVHISFRKAELEALAAVAEVDLYVVYYSDDTPFCLVDLPSEADARKFISRSILSLGIYELLACGADYESLHANVRAVHDYLKKYEEASFKFEVDAFQGKRTSVRQREIIESFDYMPLRGPIRMSSPDIHLCVFEYFDKLAPEPKQLYLGRWIAKSGRDAITKYDLKKRRYIATTSMDAELSLVSANLTLAAPGKIVYDPFVGTGSFSVTAAHFGAQAMGSDIFPKSMRGTIECNLLSNFAQYGTESYFLDSFVADLTNTPVRLSRWIDGIICDPPYGIREGPKTLGLHSGREAKEVLIDGVPAHYRENWIPPRRQYDFDEMMADILEFGYQVLVDEGRLSMWMPTANDEDAELPAPAHPGLELMSACVQTFHKWSRKLLTYRRLPGMLLPEELQLVRARKVVGKADELNKFRRKYFQGFKPGAT